MTNIQCLIANIRSQLASVYPPDEAESLAWWIAEEETGLNRSQLQFGCKDTTFSAHMQEIIDRLLNFEPIQYIFGHTLWNGLDLKVTPATLIPRPETAELVSEVGRLTINIERPKVLDIGTGSGCIAIALKKRHPEWEVTGIDISAEAVKVAKENAERNGVEVNFIVADIFDSSDFNGENLDSQIPNTFDIVVSNPPYICEKEKAKMRRNVLDYEPETALFVPDEDSLRFYRRIAELYSHRKRPEEGYLFFEINEAYGAEVANLLRESGYSDIHIIKDIYGKERIVKGRMAE